MTDYWFAGGDANDPDDYLIQDPDNPENYIAPTAPPGSGDTVYAAGTMTSGALDVESILPAAYNSPVGGGALAIASGSATAMTADDVFVGAGASLDVNGTGANIGVSGTAHVESLDGGSVGSGSLTASTAVGTVYAGGGTLNIGSLDLAYTPSAGIGDNVLGVSGAGTVANIGQITFGSAADDQGFIEIDDGGELSTGSITLGTAGGPQNTIEIAGAGSTLDAPGGIDFVDGVLYLGYGASYESPGGVTLGADPGYAGTIEVDDATALTVNGALVIGGAGYGDLTVNGGAATIDGDVTVAGGTLWTTAGTVTVDGDFDCTDYPGEGRGNVLMQGGTIDVTGTAAFGEHSDVSDQFLILSNPDEALATFEAGNLVFGSQTVTTDPDGHSVYTGVTFGSLSLAGLLIVDNTLTLNVVSYINVSDNTAAGPVTGGGVEIGSDLVDSGGLAADDSVPITIGQSAKLLGGGIGLNSGASLEIGGTGHAIAGGAMIDPGGTVIGNGGISTQVLAYGTSTTAPVYAPIVNKGKIEAEGGALALDGALTGDGQVLVAPHSTLTLGGAVDDDVTIMFLPGGGQELVLDDPEDFKGVISSENFEPGDKIDLPNVPYIDPGSADLNPDGASFQFETGEDEPNYVLQVVEDDKTYDIAINQDTPWAGAFTLSDDGRGGTLVTYTDDAVTDYSTTATADGRPLDPYAGVVDIQTPGEVGTGFIIAPGVVLTAAHVVEQKNKINAVWNPVKVKVYKGGVLAGTGKPYYAKGIAVNTSYNNVRQDFSDVANDYAVIYVPGLPYSPNSVFALKSDFSHGDVTVAGYPADTGSLLTRSQSKESTVSDTADVNGGLLIPGQIIQKAIFNLAGYSGGPFYTEVQGDLSAVGLVSHGDVSVAFTPAVKAKIEALEKLAQQNAKPVKKSANDPSAGLSLNSPLVVKSVRSSKTGEVGAGELVHLTLKMSQAVTVDLAGGAPILGLNDGATATYDAAASKLSAGKLVFDYTVGVDDEIANLAVTSVDLPTATSVRDATGHNADFSAADDAPTGLQVGAAFIKSITPSLTGAIKTGQTEHLTLAMSEAVTVRGSPTLTLSDGAAARYDAAASKRSAGSLVFNYKVQASNYTSDLTVLGVDLNGGEITDAHGVKANLSAVADDNLGLDVNAAVVTQVTASPRKGEAKSGGKVTLTLTMSGAVTVNTTGGSPTLSLNDGGTATFDAAASKPSAGKLTFAYTVGASDETPDLEITQVNLNGATIDGAHGHAADLSAAATMATRLQVGPAYITSIAPSLTGAIKTGQTDQLTLTMSQAVTVNKARGSPKLTLSDGAAATYDAAASKPSAGALVFNYKVGASNYTTDLAVLGVDLNGAKITDAHGVKADLSAPADDDLALDVNAAIVTNVTASLSTGEADSGQQVTLTLTMSEAVTVDASGGSPTLDLSDGAVATYDAAASNPSAGALAFVDSVGAGDETPDLEVTQVNLNGATIDDPHGHAADLSAAAAFDTGLQVGPAFVDWLNASQSGDLATGETVELTLAMSQAVTVNTAGGSPTLSLSDGAVATYAAAQSNPSAGTLAFDYKVGAGDYATDLTVLGVDPNGATFTDAHGVEADLSGAANDDLALDVNAATVTHVTASPSTGAATSGQEVTLTLTMSEAVTVNTTGGSPTLYLNDGGIATYDAAASNPSAGALAFVYSVGAGDETPDLQIAEVNLNGATIDDAHGHAADLSAAATMATGLQVGPGVATDMAADSVAIAAPPTIASAAYANQTWTLKGTATANGTITVYDGSKTLGTTTANATGAWMFTTNENESATRDFTATATDALGAVSAASAPLIEGSPGNDTFDFASGDELLSLAGLYGNGGTVAIDLTAAATLTDADFANVHGVQTLQLSGTSSATLGADAAKAGIIEVKAGAGATGVTDTLGKALTIGAAALGATLTLVGKAKFTVTGLKQDLAAAAATGKLTVTATGKSPETIVLGSGADTLTAAHGGDTITGGGGADRFDVVGHTVADRFVYDATSDSLDTPGAYDIITGFADQGNGAAFNDVIDLSAIAGIAAFDGKLSSPTAEVAADSIAYRYDASLNATLIFANASATSEAQTNPSLMEIELAGGDFKLTAANFKLA